MSVIVPYLATIGMTAASAASAYSNSQDQAKAYRRNAENAQAETKNKIAVEREKYRRKAESQRAQAAASGVTLDSGSVLDTLAATDAEAEVAAQNLQYSGSLQAANWQERARSATSAGIGGLTGSLLGGAKRMIR